MSTAEPPKPASLPGVKSLILLWVIFGILGFCGPYTLIVISELDYFVHWEKVGTAPPEMGKLLGGNVGQIFIRTTAGQILSCNTSENDECWIPDIYLSGQVRQCDISSEYFNSLTHPPRDIVDCVEIQDTGAEYSLTIVYALDQQGYIWKWQTGGPGPTLLTIVFAPLFGLLGVMIGSGVWTIRWALRKRSLSKDQLQPSDRTRSFALWTLVALPVLCVLSIAVVINIADIFHTRPSTQNDPIYTSAAATLNVEQTANAVPFLIAVTPNPAGPAYDFADQCQSAKWSSLPDANIICSGPHSELEPSVERLLIGTGSGELQLVGNELLFNLPQDYGLLIGDYPVWDVRTGDHFRAVLKCHDPARECDLIFSIKLRQQDGRSTLIGQWRVTTNPKDADIDVDLSRFVGERVSFSLEVRKTNGNRPEKAAYLIIPRIENTPSK